MMGGLRGCADRLRGWRPGPVPRRALVAQYDLGMPRSLVWRCSSGSSPPDTGANLNRRASATGVRRGIRVRSPCRPSSACCVRWQAGRLRSDQLGDVGLGAIGQPLVAQRRLQVHQARALQLGMRLGQRKLQALVRTDGLSRRTPCGRWRTAPPAVLASRPAPIRLAVVTMRSVLSTSSSSRNPCPACPPARAARCARCRRTPSRRSGSGVPDLVDGRIAQPFALDVDDEHRYAVAGPAPLGLARGARHHQHLLRGVHRGDPDLAAFRRQPPAGSASA